MPEIIYENHLKGEYSVENGENSFSITSSSCYRMKAETLALIDNLPREGSREFYMETLSAFGLDKAPAIFERLVALGALRVKTKTPLFKKITGNIIKPDIKIFPAKWQENILKKAGVTLSRAWLLGNLKMLFLLSASGIALSLVISFTSLYPWLAGMSSGRPGTVHLFALVLLGSLVHELGHSFMAAACGIGLRPIGFSVYLFYPVFYTNVSGMEKLSAMEKAAIDCGGFFSQSAYLFFLLFLWLFTKNLLFLESVRWISVIIVFNLNPFLRTDGYWLYKDVRKGLANNKFTDSLHYLYIIAFSAFSLYLFAYVYSRTESIYGLILSAYHDPKLLLREGYRIILGFYLIIMFFVGGVRRFQETRQEWLELRNKKIDDAVQFNRNRNFPKSS